MDCCDEQGPGHELGMLNWRGLHGMIFGGQPVSVVDLVAPARLRREHGFDPVPGRGAVKTRGRIDCHVCGGRFSLCCESQHTPPRCAANIESGWCVGEYVFEARQGLRRSNLGAYAQKVSGGPLLHNHPNAPKCPVHEPPLFARCEYGQHMPEQASIPNLNIQLPGKTPTGVSSSVQRRRLAALLRVRQQQAAARQPPLHVCKGQPPMNGRPPGGPYK